MDAQTMVQAAQMVGKKYGYDNVEAEFVEYADFKLRWKRSYKWISFQVSDYLQVLPDSEVEGFFETIFKRIRGEPRTGYTDGVVRCLTSPEFSKRYAETFIERHRTFRPDDGRVRVIYDRLVAKGIALGEMPTLVISNRSGCSPGESSILMKVVALNEKILDESEEIQDIALHTLLFHQANMKFGHENKHLWEDLSMQMGDEYIRPLIDAGYEF